IRKVIVGQTTLVERLVIGLLADGHLLLEGVPGLAKTLAVRTIARGIDASFSRIQFTPDLLPADVIGTLIFNPKTQEFVVRRGPVRGIYADERIKGYLAELVAATREPKSYGLPELGDFVSYGASPRATLSLLSTARAHAFLQGRGYVVPEDVKDVAPDVLRHRVLLTYEAEAENVSSDQVITRILE